MKKAWIVQGGWDGHEPKLTSKRFAGLLEKNGYEATIFDSLDCLGDLEVLMQVDLLVACWTCLLYTSFGDLWKAFLRQTEHFIRRSLAVNDAFEPYIADVSPSNVFSATIENALQIKRDAYQNGSVYNNSVVLFTGFASTLSLIHI